jgi:Lectin C-type domain
LNRSAAAAVVVACAGTAGALALAAACIPDLPADQPSAASSCGDGIVDLSAGEQCDPGPGAVDAGIGACSPTCRMQCPGGGTVWPGNNHCYQVASAVGAATFQRASDSCTGGSHVVTFASEDELRYVLPLVDSGRPFWVGLEMGSLAPGSYGSADTFEPGWSQRCPGCYAHGADSGAPIPAFPGTADAGAQDCVAALSDPAQPWNEYPCRGIRSTDLAVVCELEPVGQQSMPCEAGICIDIVKTLGQKTYVYQAQPTSAALAAAACAALGGSLVVLQSRDEREQLWRELSRLTVVPTAVWIGLTQVTPASRHVSAAWQWDDSTPADGPDAAYPSEWATGQPQDGTTRAFLYQSPSASPVDDTLASSDPSLTPSDMLPYVCEIPRR